MPRDNTPQYSTYATEMVPLMKELNNRDASATKDNEYINVFFEIVQNKITGENEYIVIKRPGSSSLTSAVGTGEVRGMFYWSYDTCVYYAIGTGLYKHNVVTGVSTTINATYFATSTGDVGFTEYLYEPVGAYGAIVLLLSDGTDLYQIDSGGVTTKCTDADMPTPHLPQPIFLDGYLILVKKNSADIYNSDLNNPLSWTSGNYLTAEFAADNITSIAKLNNYFVTFGTNSIEYFWDAANATGSPFQSNPTPIKINGYLGGMAQLGNKIYFVGNNEQSEPCIYFLEDFKITPVNSQIIRKYLSSLSVDLTSSIKGTIISTVGHDFYCMNVDGQTYILELESGLLTRWAWQSNAYFNLNYAINVKSSVGYKPIFAIAGSTKLYYFSPSVYQDDGSSFTWTIITDNQEFKTFHRKSMSRVIIWADKPPGSLPVDFSWTDDDYQTYSTPITKDLYQEKPTIDRLGTFIRRAFKLTSSANQPMRMFMLECEINKGNR